MLLGFSSNKDSLLFAPPINPLSVPTNPPERLEIKVIVEIIRYLGFVEGNQKIHVALVVETVRQDRTEGEELADLMLST